MMGRMVCLWDNPNILYNLKATRGWAVFIVDGDMPS